MSEFLRNKTGVSIVAILFASFLFSALCPALLATDVSAYTASLSTSGTVNVDVVPNTEGDKALSVNEDSVNVITDCKAGYNLTISSSVTDRNLYKDGNSSNNTSGQYFTPVDGTSQLSNTTNQYGYSLTANTESGVFTPLPLPSAPTFLRTTSQTASESDIDDDISVYYGVSTSNTLAPGLYKMPNSGYILYQLTLDESCNGYTIEFNPNGGTGTMSSQSNPMDTASNLIGNTFTAPAMGQSYQNAAGTTIPATAGKMWAFWGWNTAIDGSGDWYKDRESVTNLANNGDTITLYAQWKQATLADLTASTPGQNKTIDHNTMQDMSAATCWNSDKFTAIGTPYGQATLVDTRDGNTRTYTVARLPDGYCWMTQNLNLGTSISITLTSNDTDLAEGTTFTLPASDPTDFTTGTGSTNINKATVLNDMTIPDYTVNGTTYSNKVTGYYSYAVATANTSTHSTSSDSAIFTDSICPKNWDLPTTTQYYDLRTKGNIATYNNTTASYAGKNAGNEPYYFIYGGYRKAAGDVVNTTYFNSPTSYGYLWTANNYSSISGRSTYVYSGGLYDSSTATYYNKYYGLGIRCVTNMDDAMAKVTFVNTETGETQTQTIGIIGENNTIALQQHPTTWTKSGYGLAGWDTNSTGTNIVYDKGQSVTLSNDITLYTVWRPTYNIQYDGNGADTGAMTNVRHTNTYENDVFDLFASNYSKAGYGFAGWSFDQNAQPGGSSRIYGPNEAITAPAPTTPGETKTLYAVWVQSAGNLQDWQGCSSMSIGDVTALKDTRDNQVYTVGKLADGNCWMMENLRLDNTYSDDSTKAQGFGGVFNGLANPETSYFSGSTIANSLYTIDTSLTTLNIITGDNQDHRFPRYNNSNTNSRATNPSVIDDRVNATSAHATSLTTATYSYGNYYTWAAAIANTENLAIIDTSQDTSICPAGWRLPPLSDFRSLDTQLGTTISSEANSRVWRSYPNNYIYAGRYDSSSAANRGYSAEYWSSSDSMQAPLNAYKLSLSNTTNSPDSGQRKYYGSLVRCVAAQGLEVKLMLNDGTNRVGGRVYGQTGSRVVLPTTLTREGYGFSGWNTASDGTGTNYTNSYTLGSSGITLYAKWTPTYTISFNANESSVGGTSGSATGTMTDQTVVRDTATSIKANTFALTGYIFYGWNTEADGTGTLYNDGQKVTNLTSADNTITLYAVWVQEAYLDTGQNVNQKLKRLAGNSSATYSTQDTAITAIVRSNTLPNNFTPATENTISHSSSPYSIYAWYDSTNTTIYYYSEATTILMNKDSSYFFSQMRALSDLSTISAWDTIKMTNMQAMFFYTGYSLSSFALDLSFWNTASVTNMYSTFQYTGYNATTFTLDLFSWDTSNVTNMRTMFYNAGYNATTFTLDLSSWNNSSVTDMSSMFHNTGRNATTWSVGDLSSWDTSSVTNMSEMFHYAGSSATTWSIGDLSSWDTSSVTSMSGMFYYAGCSANTFILDLSSWDTSSVTQMVNMFVSAGSNATTWSIGDLSSWDTSSVTAMNSMFYNAGYSATTWSVGDLSSWDTSSVTNMSAMFSHAGYKATAFDINYISSWDTSSVTNMSEMFSHAGYNVTTFVLDLSSWDTSNVTNMSGMFAYAGYNNATTWSVGDLSSWDTSSVTNMSAMFSRAGYKDDTFTLDLSSWDTSSVTNMSSMFNNAGYHATTWSVGDLSSWDTSSATDMASMFSSAGYNATTWSVGDLSSWDTSSVTNMGSMFNEVAHGATTFDISYISSWDTSSVTNMGGMFRVAGSNATTWSVGDLSSWDTSSVTSMESMFATAGYRATTFDIGYISSWDTSSVTNMGSMFRFAGYNATTWSVGDLSSWDTSSVTNMSEMFYNAGYSATTFTLNLSSWDTSSVTSMTNMFSSAGYSATTWSVTIPKTNDGTTTGLIANTTSRLYGNTTSVSATPPSGKSFTLAN